MIFTCIKGILNIKLCVKLGWKQGRSSFFLTKKKISCTSNLQNKAADGVARRQKAKNKSMNVL